MNGHFAAVGNDGPAAQQQYEHGIQVIDDEKAFKCVHIQSAKSIFGLVPS